MVDYFHLIFKSTHYNYYRIESYKKDESGKIHCDITFDSYSALRQFQDKLRKISLGLGTVVTTTVIAALIINLSTGPVLSSFAASYDFSQGGWLTEDPAALASHALSQSGWTKYSSKEAGIMAGAGQISLASSTNSITQTNNSTTTTGFNLAGVDTDSGKVSVLPVGTVGATSSVQLSVLPGQSGNGVDGSWTILSAKNINVDSNGNGGRVCADGVSYNAVAVSTTTVTLSATPTAGCYAIGDKIMLLNIQGDGVNIDNVGNYEILSIQSISTNIITFTSNKKKYYGNKINGDTNIGTATTNQKLIVQRIPQYSNVTIQSGGSLTANNWNGVNGGALTFFANGAVNVQGGGSITMSGKGYRGGDLTTRQGESYSGLGGGIDGFNNLGGGGSYYKSYIECDEFDCWTVYSYLAGGGSHSNVGEIVGDALYTGGGVYGDDSLTKLYLGSAGGFNSGTPVTSGGNGGGVIYIMADAISLTSSVSANGTTLATGAGGGGGSIYLAGNSLNLAVSSVNVAGGIGDHIKNGSGGSGRVFLKSNNFSGDYDRTSNYTNNLSSNEPNFDWTSVAISGDGSRQIAVAYGSQIYTSSDFGNTWAKRGVNAYWTSVAMSADGSYQTAVTYDDKIYISDDYGNTWTAKGLKNKWSAIAMSADGAKQTAVVNNGQVYISTDFGNTWIAKNSVRNWSSVAMSADGSRQTATALNGQIYISTDYGNTWTAKDSARNWKSVAMSADGSRQTALSLSDYGQIFTLNSVIASSLLDILYQTSGIFTSGFINTGQKNNAWGNLGWNATPNGQTIAMKARSCATSDCAGATAWTTCTSIVNGQNLSTGGCVNSGDRYIQYQAAFSSTDETATPILNDVTIGFINFPTAASLISSPYNSSDATNMLSKITWAQGSKPAGTDIKFQIRTAPNSGIVPGTWTSWEGPDGTSDSYFINYDGLDIMPVNFQTGDNDQWFQYKITLISDGVSAPSISAVNMIYVINAAPTVSSVTAEQLTANATTTTPQGDILAPAGSVVINASVVDVDTDQGSYAGGAMRNRVEVSLKYYDSGVWTDIATSAVQGLLSDSVSTHYLDQVSTSTPHTFNLIWNPGDGFNNHENDIDFKIQIVASDKEAANSIGTSSSLIFPVDAKAPTVDTDSDSYNVLKVDARQTGAMAADEVKITFKATDISDTYYRYSLSSSTVNGLLLADGLNIDSGQWILDNGIKSGASTTIKVIASTTAVYIQYKDSLNNFDQNFYDAIIPPRVTSIMVQDVTNTYITPSDVHLYLAWKESVMPVGGVNVGEFKAYHVERAEYATDPGVNFTPLNSDFAPLGISTDRHVNFFTDSNVVKDYHYYYRVYLEDGVGNYSYYTSKSDTNIVMHGVPNGIQDFGEGGGGTSVGVPPVITSVEIIEILTTQAEIVWNTSVLSNSSVEYIATTTVPVLAGFANAPFKGIATMLNDNNGLGKHRVVIDGLDSNTEYYFRVKSTSADGTEGSSLDETYHFTTLDGPKIASSTIIVTGKTNNSMTIVWATDIPANSFVGYSLDPNMISPAPVEVGQDDSETSHSVTLNSLKQGTRYYFYVKSGTGKDNNLGQYYSDMTTSDATPPGNTNINSQVKRTSAVVTWQADEVSRSIFSYGTSTNDYAIGISNDILTTTHLVDLANLKSDTTYYYQLFSVDASGNVSATTTGEFTTEGISLTDVIASTTSETAVKITWSTNENTSSQVEYNSDPAFPTLTSAFEPMYPSDSTKNHEIEISGLVQSTKYYYRVISTTADNYTTQSPLYYFTSGDLIAPVISGVIAINVSSNGATINWQTDETANSIVEWGTSTANYLASTSDDIMTRTHSVNISGLNAFTDYYFRVTSFDTNSNATTSAEYSLKTSNLKITNVFASAATTTTIISWDTDQAATSQVEYTTNANFIGSNFSTDATATTTHIITLSSLSDGTVYYYKVRSVKDGYSQESPVYTFSTTDQTVPVIETSPQVSIITDTTATIFWETNETSDSVVHYGETTGGPYVSENSSRLSTLHFLKLSGLTASTTYYYYAKSQDGGGNLATSSEYSFTTLATQVTHEELVNPGDPTVIQSDTEAIVSIPNTNTTATSKICYSTLVGINMDTCTGLTILTPTRTHSYYLTNLIASTTYYIKTKTIDSEDGNKNFTSNEVSFKTLAIRYTGDDLAEKQNLIDSLELQLLSLQDKAYTEVEMQARIAEINSLSEQLSNATAGMHTDAELQEKINKINELQSQLNLVNSKSGGGALIIDKTDKTAPVISNVKIVEQGDVYAKIVWSTNEESSSMVGYGLSSDYDSAESDYQSYLKRIKNHVIYLKKLSPNTTYHFSAVSADSWGNMSASPDFALTTLAAGEEAKKDVAAEVKKDAENTLTKIQEMINELLSSGKVNPEDIRAAIQKTGEPPMISGAGPEISNVTAKSVTIAWKTNRKSNSIISYYIESMGRDSAEQVGNYSALVTDHTVNISNLAPGRKYVFVAQSVDALGNIGASDQKSFETTGIPFVSEVSMSNITNTSIEISWLSNTETTSELDYGSTPAYGQTAKADSNNSVVNHSLRLSDLKSGQTYHFKAKGASRKGDVISSDDYTFTTLTSFDVLTYSINKITDKSANVTWKTTNESTSEIEYTNITSKVTDSMRSGDFTKDHEIKLVNLFPGTRYTFKIKGKDKHDQATESKGFEFSTLIDTQAPIIEYVQTDMALISKGDQNSVQAVVTWKTNEPSTSEIIYAEGGAKNLPTLDSTDNAASSTGKKVSTEEVSVGNDKFTIAKDGGSLTSKHVLVITDFKPSTVYTFKARSIDEAGNVSYSKDYTVLAPSKEESVLQIIIKTFEDTFGWLKMK